VKNREVDIREMCKSKSVCKGRWIVILNERFRWARSERCWVHLTRDVHAHQPISKPGAPESIGSRNIKPSILADLFIVEGLEQVAIMTQGGIQAVK
jgi:hypothetical protein